MPLQELTTQRFMRLARYTWLIGNTFSTHAQLIGRFNKDFVRTGRMPAAFTRILTRLFQDRQLGDYGPPASISHEQAQHDIDDARQLIAAVRHHLDSHPNNPHGQSP